jgi:hypothetical protein
MQPMIPISAARTLVRSSQESAASLRRAMKISSITVRLPEVSESAGAGF